MPHIDMQQPVRARTQLRCIIEPADLPMTVGQALKRKLHLTDHQIRSGKYRENGILRNGSRVRISQPLLAGDEVCFAWETADTGDGRDTTAGMTAAGPLTGSDAYDSCMAQAAQPALDILYEDADMLIVNKPAGIAVHPGRGHYADTLADQVLAYTCGRHTHAENGASAGGPVRVIGRLDKDTSGVVLFAKSAIAAARLSQQPGTVHYKIYRALALGVVVPEAGQCKQIDFPVRKKPGTLNEMEAYRALSDDRADRCVPDGYMAASTKLRVIGSAGDNSCTLVEAIPVTGRTHQIRVHMAAMGHPLLGDPIYGSPDGLFSRAALHCRELHVQQPFTGEQICVKAPYPEDFRLSTAQLFPCLPAAEI